MQRDLSTAVACFRCIGRSDEHDLTASICSFACEMCSEQPPACIENALGQMVILNHVLDTEIFNSYVVVASKQSMTQLVEKIPALIGNAFMLPLQHGDSLAPIRPAFLASGHTALGDAQPFLGSTVPGRMFHMLTITGGDERGEPDIDANIDASRWHRLWRNVARTDRIPLAGFAGKSQCLKLAWHLTMPAHSQTTNARHFEPATINFEPIAILLEAETFEAVPALETGIAGCFSSFDAAEEGLERFIEIAHHGLQHVTVDRSSVGIGGFVGFDLSKLFVLADRACFLLVGLFALGKTTVVPVAARL